jgi:hypothetical protein
MNGCLPLIKKCGFNYDGTALDYLCTCTTAADTRHAMSTPEEEALDKRFNKPIDCLLIEISEGKKREASDLISDIQGSYLNTGYDQGFKDGFKLGMRLGAECFKDEDTKDYRDMGEND